MYICIYVYMYICVSLYIYIISWLAEDIDACNRWVFATLLVIDEARGQSRQGIAFPTAPSIHTPQNAIKCPKPGNALSPKHPKSPKPETSKTPQAPNIQRARNPKPETSAKPHPTAQKALNPSLSPVNPKHPSP